MDYKFIMKHGYSSLWALGLLCLLNGIVVSIHHIIYYCTCKPIKQKEGLSWLEIFILLPKTPVFPHDKHESARLAYNFMY
ncbi:hypothetical protein DXA36_24610 [Eisenbergiella sp. OF01-20]|nr:hypothetical protein DXA36_24610 [Eisenbergiella sp. OF01-20]